MEDYVEVVETGVNVNGLDREISSGQGQAVGGATVGRRREPKGAATADTVQRIAQGAGAELAQAVDLAADEQQRVWAALRELDATEDSDRQYVTQTIRGHARFRKDADGAAFRMVQRWVEERGPKNDPELSSRLRQSWEFAATCGFEGITTDELVTWLRRYVPFSEQKERREAERKPTFTTITKPLSAYTEKKLEWTWPGWIPKGEVTVAGGKTKVGKSQFGIWLIARLTAGIAFPRIEFVGGPIIPEPKRAILITAEDSIEKTVLPRVLVSGGNPDLVHIVDGYIEVSDEEGEQQKRFSFEKSKETLGGLFGQHPGEIGLIVVDPVNAYQGKIDAHRNNEVRSAMLPLKELAEEHNIPVVLIHHMKKGENKGSVTDMFGGSNATVEAARAVIVLEKEPGDTDRYIIELVACNYAKTGSRFYYSIEKDGTPINPNVSKFVLDEKTIPKVSVAEVMSGAGAEEKGEVERAIDFLNEYLAGGRKVTRKELLKDAKELEIAARTLDRAKAKLGVKSGDERDLKERTWFLPSAATPEKASAETPTVQKTKAAVPQKMVLKPVSAPCCDGRREGRKPIRADPA